MDGPYNKGINQKKKKILKASTQNRKKEDWIEAKRQRNIANGQKKARKRQYIEKETQSKNPKKIWSAICKLIPSEKTKQNITSITHKEKQITDPMSIASIFNAYFTGVEQTLAEKITKDKYYKQPKIEEPTTELNLPQVTPAIIKKHIENLPNHKSSGPKELPIKTIKAAKDVIAKGLSHIIKQTLEQGKIPLRWKSAIIIPMHKGGKKDIVNNYRPISVLPFMDKILERIIKERIMTHLENQHCITDNQGGYRKNYSTITMIRKLVDHILTNRESKTPTLAVFIDKAKAFDTISHAGLIRQLQLYGRKDIELKRLFIPSNTTNINKWNTF